MSTTIITVLGILLTALTVLGGFALISQDAAGSYERAYDASDRISVVMAAVAQHRAAQGYVPTLAELEQHGVVLRNGDLAPVAMPGATWDYRQGEGVLCFVVDEDDDGLAERALTNVVRRIGPKAQGPHADCAGDALGEGRIGVTVTL